MVSLLIVLTLCLAASPVSAPVAAAPSGSLLYELTWTTVDGGGGLSAGDGYDLYLTVGQPDAWRMSCGDYPLSGGFWNRVISESVCLRYMPTVFR
jgi:hypothetical protein